MNHKGGGCVGVGAEGAQENGPAVFDGVGATVVERIGVTAGRIAVVAGSRVTADVFMDEIAVDVDWRNDWASSAAVAVNVGTGILADRQAHNPKQTSITPSIV